MRPLSVMSPEHPMPDPGISGHIVISNVFPDDNRGGAAITAATIGVVHKAFPGREVTLVSVEQRSTVLASSYRHTLARFPEVELLPSAVPVPDRSLGGLRAVAASLVCIACPRFGRRYRALRRVAEADAVVSKGGYVFVDREGFGGILSLWLTTLPLVYGSRCGVGTAVFSSTVGPFRHRASRLVAGWILRRTDLVLVRDGRSRFEALALGLPHDRVVEVPDSVFGHQPPSPAERERIAEQLGFGGSAFGAVTVRAKGDARERNDYLERLSEAVKLVLARGIVERIAVVVQVDGLHTRDIDGSRALIAKVADPRVTLVDQDLSPAELIAFYGAARFVVGSRMHSAIFSLVAGTPAVGISIDGTKVEGVFESLGLGDLVFAYSSFDPLQLADALTAAVREGPAMRKRIEEAATRSREDVEGAYRLLEPLARLHSFNKNN